MRTLLILLILLRLAMAIPFHNGVKMGLEALRSSKVDSTIAVFAGPDDKIQLASP